MAKRESGLESLLRFFSSLKCGLMLLGVLGAAIVIGTMILQRPMVREGQIEQVYAPQTIRLLNYLGLFDVFHTWWFILLLGLLGANIAFASLERFPQVWRLFVRPHTVAEEWFVRGLPYQREIPLGGYLAEDALLLASHRAQVLGYQPRPQALERGTLYIEKHRWARLAPYVVHTSLLIIFAGAITDGVWGYRGFMNLGPGMRSQELEPLTTSGTTRRLGFAIRCDGAGMEKYPDGSPRQYWSKLAVEENGREVFKQQIFVNDPLTYKGVRFFQTTYGATGVPDKLTLDASWTDNDGKPVSTTLSLRPGQPVPLDQQGRTVELSAFVPDFVLDGNQISSRSDEPRNPAIQLNVGRAGDQPAAIWIFPQSPETNTPNETGIKFEFRGVEMGYMTGLQVAHEPGQGLIWVGCCLLTGGLMMALYLSHVRIWGVVGRDRKGKPVLLLGGQPSKYREAFEVRFNELAGELEKAIKTAPVSMREQIPA